MTRIRAWWQSRQFANLLNDIQRSGQSIVTRIDRCTCDYCARGKLSG